MQFDGVIARAEAFSAEKPLRATLSQSEIARMSQYFLACLLRGDEHMRRDGFDPVALHKALVEQGIAPKDVSKMIMADAPDARPRYGLSDGELEKHSAALQQLLPKAERALAKGDIDSYATDEILEAFGIAVDPCSAAYRQLGLALLRELVERIAINRAAWIRKVDRHAPDTCCNATVPISGDTLHAAYLGWLKARKPAPGTLAEYERAIKLFTELHGDMPVVNIKRSHARQFRESLQDVPRDTQASSRRCHYRSWLKWGKGTPTRPGYPKAPSTS